MAHDFDSVRPIGGLNYEDEVRAIPEGDYLYAENIRNSITAANKGKTLTNVLGNLKIQQYNCPYNGGVFPSGKNRCIGAVEDIVNNGAIYMVWNSEGKHGIYRYYRDKTDPANPYGVVEQVIQYDFGWTKRTRITSMNIAYGDPAASGRGDLLYWCDPVPKKINLTKGNICSKYKTWNVVLPKGFAGTSIFFQVIVRAFLTNAPIASINVTVTAGQSISEIMTSIAAQINAGLSTYISAEACDCSITITEKTINGYDVVFSDNIFYVIPDNWYGKTLIDRFWDRCKWQPMQAPQNQYAQDDTYNPNYVDGKVFQFRLQYLYDDGEPSALGVWSQIAINNLSCDGNTDSSYNYIDVNFNDPLLLDTQTLVVLKNVRVIARELNTGNDRFVIELPPCEFLDYANGSMLAHYDFYNNIESAAVDAILAAKLYDDVPLESGAEILSNNRMVELNCLTGYDAPACAPATYKIDFGGDLNPKLYKVKIRIRVLSWAMGDAVDSIAGNFYEVFPSYRKYPFWQDTNPDVNYSLQRGGVFHDTSRTENDFPFFGGGGFGVGGGGDFGIRAGMEDNFDQRLPEGGWPVYSAGTKFFSVSKQIYAGLPQDSVGALDTSTEPYRNSIGEYLYAGSDLYSIATLYLPEGEHIIRLGSHWCSFADKLGKGFAYDLTAGTTWQRTSTNVWGIYPPGSGDVPQYTPNSFTKRKEIKITVNSDIEDGGTFVVMDLSPPWDYNSGIDPWRTFNGYLYNAIDESGNEVVDVNSVAYAGIPVEKTLVKYDVPPPDTLDSAYDAFCTTDHNGYFFGIPDHNTYGASRPYYRMNAYQVNNNIICDTNVIWTGSLTQLYEKTTLAIDFNGINQPGPTFDTGLTHGIITTNQNEARANCSTFINGVVVNSQGTVVPGATIILENGQVRVSDINGEFSIPMWGDMVTPNAGNFSNPFQVIQDNRNRVVDYLVYSLPVFCVPIYPNGQRYLPLVNPIGNAPNRYNPDNPFVVPDFVIDETSAPEDKTRKRGGQYIDAIRYYDDSGRLCSVVELYSIYIPYITEDVSILNTKPNYEDPNQYPAGTYLHGKPIISWYLSPDFKPPVWASYYQLMRTKNLIQGRYLQWAANDVIYLSAVETTSTPEIQTSFANQDAVAAKINMENIVFYDAQNTNSQVGYSFQEGDRLRLICNRERVFYEGIYDFEVLTFDEVSSSIVIKLTGNIEIKSGSVFEILNPNYLSDNEQRVFYEVGEVYECTAPNTPNNEHSVLSATFTNGDTYWHGRYIPINDDITNFSTNLPVVIEDASISDFYPSQAQDIGRIGIVDPNFKQIRRPMLLKASNQFIPATAVNGLSSFEALNEKELDRANGAIQRAVAINQYIVAISNVRETSNYIQVVTFQQATQGQGVLAIADQFFGTAYPHSKTLGTDFPASVFINDGQIFGFHSKRADVWLYRGDGETTISDKKMKNYFQGLSASGVSDAVAVYDRFHEEYILTVWRIYSQQTTVDLATVISGGYNVTVTISSENPQPVVGENISYKYYQNGQWQTGEGEIATVVIMLDGSYQVVFTTQTSLSIRLGGQISVSYSSPETISWFNGSDAIEKNGWATFYSFTPEAYCQMGSNILSFKDGEVWIHGENSTRNNFYGQQYVSKVTPVFNDKPEYLKVWNSCILMQYQDNNGNNWSAPVIQNNNGQLSRLKEGSWVKKGEHWYAAFKRDLNDLSVNQAIRISQGRALRSTSLTAELENGYTGEVTLYGWLANWTYSERTSK